MEALTLGSAATTDDDYGVTINVLKFGNAAGAQAELDYSNSQNKKDAPTVPLPGFPKATAFFNKATPSQGISIGAFTTTGPYQVVVILGGLADNNSSNETAFLAETARVMRAVLPIASTIEPETARAGGTTLQIPGPVTPTPSGTHVHRGGRCGLRVVTHECPSVAGESILSKERFDPRRRASVGCECLTASEPFSMTRISCPAPVLDRCWRLRNGPVCSGWSRGMFTSAIRVGSTRI